MSNALAIASVSALLRNLLDNGVVDDTIVSTVGTVRVSALAPDLISATADSASQINLFLYQVTPNLGWRNAGLPSRDDRGERRANPPLALDLHYLVTAYAGRDLHAEILLGRAMQILHECPGFSREGIRKGLGVPDLVSPGGMLPPDLLAIGTSELDDQIEAVKITPQFLGTDEMSKLWAALQSKMRPSMTYAVSVVLITARRPTQMPLPVTRRKLYVSPLRAPRIERVRSQETPGGPILTDVPILAGQRLVLVGTQLQGERTLVKIGSASVQPQADAIQDRQIIVQLPATLSAGLHAAQVVHETLLGEPPVPHAGVSSNLAAFVLRPQVRVAQYRPAPNRIHLEIDPALVPSQRAVAFLNELVPPGSPPMAQPPRAYSFPVDSLPAPATAFDIPLEDPSTNIKVDPGQYLVRLQIDGAESPLHVDSQGRFDQPAITVP